VFIGDDLGQHERAILSEEFPGIVESGPTHLTESGRRQLQFAFREPKASAVEASTPADCGAVPSGASYVSVDGACSGESMNAAGGDSECRPWRWENNPRHPTNRRR
jgi:hypothetical protein